MAADTQRVSALCGCLIHVPYWVKNAYRSDSFRTCSSCVRKIRKTKGCFVNAMFKRYLTIFLALAFWGGAGKSQDITKGSISGVVRDASGAVVSGVRVHLSSPNGDRETTTDSI